MKRTKFNILIATGMTFALLFAGCSAKDNTVNKTANAAETAKTTTSEVKSEPDTKEITDAKEKLKNDPMVQDFEITKKSDRVVVVINLKSDANTKSITLFTADYANLLRRAYKVNSAEMKIMQNGNVLNSVTVE